jgi:hypothetical protein
MEWFVQICMAICYLHKNRWIHRDLKPHNIFLTSHRRIVKVRAGQVSLVSALLGCVPSPGGRHSESRQCTSPPPPEMTECSLRHSRTRAVLMGRVTQRWERHVTLFPNLVLSIAFPSLFQTPPCPPHCRWGTLESPGCWSTPKKWPSRPSARRTTWLRRSVWDGPTPTKLTSGPWEWWVQEGLVFADPKILSRPPLCLPPPPLHTHKVFPFHDATQLASRLVHSSHALRPYPCQCRSLLC